MRGVSHLISRDPLVQVQVFQSLHDLLILCVGSYVEIVAV